MLSFHMRYSSLLHTKRLQRYASSLTLIRPCLVFLGLTFDRAVLFLNLDDPGRARLPGGLQGHARLVQALLPEVVGAALGAPPALRSCIRAALRIDPHSALDIHILTSVPSPVVYIL